MKPASPVSTDSFRLRYLAKTAAGVPRDLVTTAAARFTAIRPTVLIYNCTWVCDAAARCATTGSAAIASRT